MAQKFVLNIMNKIIDQTMLSHVEKPSRYTGGEYNMVVKDHDTVSATICLSFPEVYELGMSYVGFKILYHYINSFDEFYAERAYMPWPDMSSRLLTGASLLSSVETQTALGDFDIIGFTLQSELSYTNILAMLKLGNIHILSEQRSDNEPIIIAGGPNSVNPMPMSLFVDAFIIGDGEQVVIDILRVVSDKNLSREEKLKKISALNGVFVPQIHKSGEKISQNIIKDLDTSFFPEHQIVPFLQCVHDRAVVEVMRGCPHGCRFCQAGFIYRPTRIRSFETVKQLSENILKNTGYENISFSSLSTGDHPHLKELVDLIIDEYAHDQISVSLPSLRVDSATLPIFKKIQKVKKTGVTLAPEAGSQRLRNIINKKITTEQIIDAVDMLCNAGWRKIKLYFIIGLPHETQEDIDEMIELIRSILKTGRKITAAFSLNITLSTFIPKPHTPFQWCAMASREYISETVKKVCDSFNRRSVKVNWDDYDESVLECVLCRGDKRVADVIYSSFLDGCSYDGWNEYLNMDVWYKNIEKHGLDVEKLKQCIAQDVELPWDFIDIGAGKQTLLNEYKQAAVEHTTESCNFDTSCNRCEACRR